MTRFTCFCNLSNNVRKSLSLENGSGMDREWIENGSAFSHKLFASIIFLLFLGVNYAWGANPTVTYTVTSTSAVTTSGIAPENSSATFSQTYGTAKQATAGNSFTLTLSNFNVKKVVGFQIFHALQFYARSRKPQLQSE